MTDRDRLAYYVDRIIELETELKKERQNAQFLKARFEEEYKENRARKYWVDSTYLLESAEQYGISRRSMDNLLIDWFGFDGKGGHGRE